MRLVAIFAAVAIAALPLSAASRPLRAAQDADARASAPRVVVDGYGRKVAIPAQVNRIVTLAPNLTETVYALGLGDKLVGDTNDCDKPAAAREKPHVGDYVNPNLEAIVALRPDLVLATSANRVDTVDALGRLGIPVYATNPRSVLDMLDSLQRVADVTGAREQGANLVARLRARLDALHARLADRPVQRVLFVIWDEPLMTIGRHTFIADALRWAGAESALSSDQSWPQISMEEVLRLQPDYIVFAAHNEGARRDLQELRARPVWRDLDAVQMGHVVDLSEEALRPSPGLVDAIEQLAREMHPDAFGNQTGN
ncbi:MAG: cobalamin-binding protein [Acidobacteriota bacterium]|nr:cobalamin-binding protein [Acidobacteriota bacterium]